MNAYWEMSTSGMEHLLNVGIFGSKVLQEGVSESEEFLSMDPARLWFYY